MAEQAAVRLVDHLPEVFLEDPRLPAFLEPFQEVFGAFAGRLSSIADLFDPAVTPEEFLPWLAEWVALDLDEAWGPEKCRDLIARAIALYGRRGTVGGLKEYLSIYTGLQPEIRECRWPGGMQIGVASRIGGIMGTPDGWAWAGDNALGLSDDAFPAKIIGEPKRTEPQRYDDYYVVTKRVEGEVSRYLYRAERVKQVEVDTDQHKVTIRFVEEAQPPAIHEQASVGRMDGMIDDSYTLRIQPAAEQDPPGEEYLSTYRGDGLLIDEIEQPYRFVVDVRVPRPAADQVRLDKVRAILDREKPAHTIYYLKLTPVVSAEAYRPIQIGPGWGIGLDRHMVVG